MYEYVNESVSQGPPLWVVHEWIMSGSWVLLSLVFSRGHILVSQTGQDWIKIFFSPNSWVRSVRFTAGKALGEIWFMRGRCKKKSFMRGPGKKFLFHEWPQPGESRRTFLGCDNTCPSSGNSRSNKIWKLPPLDNRVSQSLRKLT